MNKHLDPKDLVVGLLDRSECAVQVAAVLVDSKGAFSWGWNHAGPDGFGQHAEVHCLRRANMSRIDKATIYVAAQRNRNGKVVLAKPCPDCAKVVKKCKRVIYRDALGDWIEQ